MSANAHFRRDMIKLIYLMLALFGTSLFFLIAPGFTTPTLLSIIITMVLSPVVVALERRGVRRSYSILVIFAVLGMLTGIVAYFALSRAGAQWELLRAHAPDYFSGFVAKLREYESLVKEKIPVLQSAQPTESFLAWGQETGRRFVTSTPALMGQFLAWVFIIPIMSFVLLNEGPQLRRKVFRLVPNRFFEMAFLVTHKISTGISDYIRAKLLEAFLVGLMTTTGLAIIDFPYALVLGLVAGATNIIPYLGPLLGAAPGILIALIDPSHASYFVPVVLVYLIVNAIDMAFIFPVIVGKLVDLHPLVLLAAVAIGQKYYGLIGMLISIPIASSVKVVLAEIYNVVYEHAPKRETFHAPAMTESPVN